MQAAQLTVPTTRPVVVSMPTAPKQPALDLRLQTLSRCWGP